VAANARADGLINHAHIKRGADVPRIGNSSSRHDRNVTGQVDDQRHEHERADPAPVTAGLGPLGDEHVGTGLERGLGSLNVTNRLKPEDASVVSLVDQIPRYPHVEGDGRRFEGERGSKRLRIERPAGVVYDERSIGASEASPVGRSARDRTTLAPAMPPTATAIRTMRAVRMKLGEGAR
jgi:hypothetical protein